MTSFSLDNSRRREHVERFTGSGIPRGQYHHAPPGFHRIHGPEEGRALRLFWLILRILVQIHLRSTIFLDFHCLVVHVDLGIQFDVAHVPVQRVVPVRPCLPFLSVYILVPRSIIIIQGNVRGVHLVELSGTEMSFDEFLHASRTMVGGPMFIKPRTQLVQLFAIIIIDNSSRAAGQIQQLLWRALVPP